MVQCAIAVLRFWLRRTRERSELALSLVAKCSSTVSHNRRAVNGKRYKDLARVFTRLRQQTLPRLPRLQAYPVPGAGRNLRRVTSSVKKRLPLCCRLLQVSNVTADHFLIYELREIHAGEGDSLGSIEADGDNSFASHFGSGGPDVGGNCEAALRGSFITYELDAVSPFVAEIEIDPDNCVAGVSPTVIRAEVPPSSLVNG
jgi:hypothetical protein